MDWSNILVAVLGFLGSLIAVYFSNRKSAALIEYRITQLEHKQDAHNQMIERTYRLEETVAVLDNRVDNLEKAKGA